METGHGDFGNGQKTETAKNQELLTESGDYLDINRGFGLVIPSITQDGTDQQEALEILESP